MQPLWTQSIELQAFNGTGLDCTKVVDEIAICNDAPQQRREEGEAAAMDTTATKRSSSSSSSAWTNGGHDESTPFGTFQNLQNTILLKRRFGYAKILFTCLQMWSQPDKVIKTQKNKKKTKEKEKIIYFFGGKVIIPNPYILRTIFSFVEFEALIIDLLWSPQTQIIHS